MTDDQAKLSDGLTADEKQQLVPDLLARRFAGDPRSYWRIVWDDFRRNRAATIALWVMAVMAVIAVFAPMIADHRPYVLAEGDGVSFPLLVSLRANDWVLQLGFVQLIAAVVFHRRARRRGGEARPIGVSVLVAIAFAPAVLSAMLTSPQRAMQQGVVWWTLVIGCGLLGIVVVARAAGTLYTNRRDEFDRLRTGGATVAWLFGSLLILVAAGFFGTINRPALDTTDYHALAEQGDAWAIFPPVPHDYIAPQSYMRNDPPGGPFARVVPSGGSNAASDLGLTPERRHANLVLEAGGPITADTPLSALRYGAGVRVHDAPISDFTVVAHSLDRYSVMLFEAVTIGDVLAAVDEATGGLVQLQIASDGSRLGLVDATPPRPRHWLGTDGNGSDVAARLVRATRVALSIGFVSTGIAVLIGVIFGALMGYFGGWVDMIGMRIIEIFMAIPRLFLLLTVIAFIPPRLNQYMLYAMMAVIGSFSWMNAARFIRAEFLRLRDQDFVQAARASGLPVRSILFKHMLPNGVTPVLVDASFLVAAAIFVETGLSFLGFGIKPPDPSWGQMLSRAVDPSTGVFYWWLAIFPGVMIFVTVFAFNLIGDALRDAIDPKLKKAAH